MKLLYLYGLDSSLSEEKKQILEKFGTIVAPDIDYRSNPNIIQTLFEKYKNEKIDVIVGSSLGGFAGFYLSKLLQIPTLLFNPALPYRTSVLQNIPVIEKEHSHLLQIVIGKQDDVILAKDNIEFISKLFPLNCDFRLHVINDLGHGIPLDVFEVEICMFFNF